MPAEPVVVVVVVESAAVARGGMPLHYRQSVAARELYLPMSCRARHLRELHSSLPMWQPRYIRIGWLRRRGLECLALQLEYAELNSSLCGYSFQMN